MLILLLQFAFHQLILDLFKLLSLLRHLLLIGCLMQPTDESTNHRLSLGRGEPRIFVGLPQFFEVHLLFVPCSPKWRSIIGKLCLTLLEIVGDFSLRHILLVGDGAILRLFTIQVLLYQGGELLDV